MHDDEHEHNPTGPHVNVGEWETRLETIRHQKTDREKSLRTAMMDAYDDKIPVSRIAKAAGVSRQTVYNLIRETGRTITHGAK